MAPRELKAGVKLDADARVQMELEIKAHTTDPKAKKNLGSKTDTEIFDLHSQHVGATAGTRGGPGAYRMTTKRASLGDVEKGVKTTVEGVALPHGATVSSGGQKQRSRKRGGKPVTEDYIDAKLTVKNVDGTDVEVPVSIVTVPDARGLVRGPHPAGARGPVQMKIKATVDASTGTVSYAAEIRVDWRLHKKDVAIPLAHELDELARVVHNKWHGADLTTQLEAGLIKPGAGGASAPSPTVHDHAIAAELKRFDAKMKRVGDATRKGISATLYYRWSEDFLGAGKRRVAFEH